MLLASLTELMGMKGKGSDIAYSAVNFITQFVIIVFVMLLAAGIGGFIAYLIVQKKMFRYNIVIFERVNGRFQPTGKDKAKKILLSESGDEALFLKKNKKLLPMPTIQTGKNTYWYFISDDREWINFGPGDFDENRKEMGAQFLDKEMRYARTALQATRKQRYEQASFLQKYGGLIAYTVLILVTAVGFWLLIGKLVDVAHSVEGAIQASKTVLQETGKILGAVENMKGGSGYIVRP